MAGITGIIFKNPAGNKSDYRAQFGEMLKHLSYSEKQLSESYICKNILLGNCVPVASKYNERYQKPDSLQICAVIDGLVFISETEKKIIRSNYNLDKDSSDYQFIPYLFDYYNENIVNHITGWYNIAIYDEKNRRAIVFNDRLGYLPLYYYETDALFIFSSKINSIVASGILPKVEFDAVTISEHLFYNYPISDNTYIKNIKTLSNAEILDFSSGKATKSKYWDTSELIGKSAVSEKDSFEYVNNSLNNAVHKILLQTEGKINLSLTGGWDSRLVLSYFLPEYRERLNVYSFGAQESDDITIPREISRNEGLHYTPYLLDQYYLGNNFLDNAFATIFMSGGTRNYKRSHYLYAIRQIGEHCDTLVSGIFGDEIFKVAQITGGTVITKDTIALLEADFDHDLLYKRFSDMYEIRYINGDRVNIIDEFIHRNAVVKNGLSKYDSVSEKYFSFRLEYNLRKYFGNEVNSYNDFVYCFSPFIDYDFLSSYARTMYMMTGYPFNSNSIRLKKMTTQLYCALTNKNYRPLIYYNTGRGYSMHDSISFTGILKILYKMRQNSKKKQIDSFSTRPTNDLFREYLIQNSITSDALSIANNTDGVLKTADINSLVFWTHKISKEYY